MINRKNTLTLLSGKGGSGKTIIALSMCKVLAEAGYKVLLIDCDFSTHGATYFFESELETHRGTVLSATDLLGEFDSLKKPIETAKGFSFIPSTIDPAELIDPTRLVSEQTLKHFSQEVEKLFDKYDAVIFDCQAGYSPIAAVAVDLSQRNLIVLEPDAVSSAALRVLYLQLGNKLRSNSTWQIFNKLTEEERPVYEKVFGGTLFVNLPPIPFDWQVRAAFATNELPGVTSEWSAFGLGIIRVMRTLFPALKEKLDSLEETSVGAWYTTVAERIEFLQVQKKKIEYEAVEKERLLRLRRIRLMTSVTTLLGVILTVVSLTSYLRIFPVEALFTNYGSFFAVIAGMLAAILPYAWYQNTVKEVDLERSQDLKRQSLSEIENELNKYTTLIATDPRLREYEKRKTLA